RFKRTSRLADRPVSKALLQSSSMAAWSTALRLTLISKRLSTTNSNAKSKKSDQHRPLAQAVPLGKLQFAGWSTKNIVPAVVPAKQYGNENSKANSGRVVQEPKLQL